MEQDLNIKAKYSQIVLDHQLAKSFKSTKDQSRGLKINFDSQKVGIQILGVTIMLHCILLTDALLHPSTIISRYKTPYIILLVQAKDRLYNGPKFTHSDDKDGLNGLSPVALVQANKEAKQPLMP